MSENSEARARRKELRELTYGQLMYYVKEAIDGESELLMKEVWEQCACAADSQIVNDTLRELHAYMGRQLGEPRK